MPGISDGEGLKIEVIYRSSHTKLLMVIISSLQIRKILEPRLNQMTPKEVREVSPLKFSHASCKHLPLSHQVMAAMLRRHLSWLIVWGGLFGALLGILSELLVVTFRFTVGVIDF